MSLSSVNLQRPGQIISHPGEVDEEPAGVRLTIFLPRRRFNNAAAW